MTCGNCHVEIDVADGFTACQSCHAYLCDECKELTMDERRCCERLASQEQIAHELGYPCRFIPHDGVMYLYYPDGRIFRERDGCLMEMCLDGTLSEVPLGARRSRDEFPELIPYSDDFFDVFTEVEM